MDALIAEMVEPVLKPLQLQLRSLQRRLARAIDFVLAAARRNQQLSDGLIIGIWRFGLGDRDWEIVIEMSRLRGPAHVLMAARHNHELGDGLRSIVEVLYSLYIPFTYISINYIYINR